MSMSRQFLHRVARKALRRTEPEPIGSDHLRKRFPQYEIGRDSYGWPDIHDWNDGTKLRIGAYCSIAAGVNIILGGGHRADWVTTFPFNVLWPETGMNGKPQSKGDIVIGNDVWIARGATILSGITIGDGAVIGAGAVVTKDVPPYAFAAGVPAVVRSYRFDQETITRLLRLQWWNWPRDRIAAELHGLCSADLAGFLDRNNG